MRLLKFAILASVAFLAYACSEEEPVPSNKLALENFTATIEENPENGDVLGSLVIANAEGSVSYELTNESPAGAIAVFRILLNCSCEVFHGQLITRYRLFLRTGINQEYDRCQYGEF